VLLEEGLHAYLAAYAGISALVGTRIYAVKLQQKAGYPALTYSRFGTIYAQGLEGGPSAVEGARIQVSCWDKFDSARANSGYAGTKLLAEQARLALTGYRGLMGTVMVKGVEFINAFDLYDDLDTVHHVALEFNISGRGGNLLRLPRRIHEHECAARAGPRF
jgi:hypothetical protein